MSGKKNCMNGMYCYCPSLKRIFFIEFLVKNNPVKKQKPYFSIDKSTLK